MKPFKFTGWAKTRRAKRSQKVRRNIDQPNTLRGIEFLERREMMTANLTSGLASGVTLTSSNPTLLNPSGFSSQPSVVRVNAMVDGRTLRVDGTDGADNITVRRVGDSLFVDGARILNNGRKVTSVNAALIDKVEVRGYKGADTIDLTMVDKPTEIWGGDGGDTINGGSVQDVVHGGNGDDWIWGNFGADFLNGDGYSDHIWGGADNDVIRGGAGGDFLNGGLDDDWIYGDTGQDELHGDDDNDFLFGGDGLYDRLFGDRGNDWLEAGFKYEFADGGDGVDYNAYEWAADGMQPGDVNQAFTRTCAFLSSLASATKFNDLSDRIVYEGDFTYRVWLYDSALGDWIPEYVRFDGSLREALGQTFDPQPNTEGEFWAIIYQRAYLQRFEGINDSNWILTSLFDGETADRPLSAILGCTSAFHETEKLTPEALRDMADAGPVIAGDGIHAYMVDGVRQEEDGRWVVLLFNPWGVDATHKPELVANPEPLTFTGSDDGFITVDWEVFKSTMPDLRTAT